MAEELQNLLDKIHNEGIKKAEAERDAMLADARKQTEELVCKAREEADAVRKQAELDREALEKRAESAIRQAARDIILALKEELKRRLAAIVKNNVDGALTPEFMAKLIGEIVSGVKRDPERASGAAINIMVAPAHLTELEKALRASLAADLAASTELFPNQAAGHGFKISTSGNQVFFDFSDAALTEMISAYAGSRVGAIIGEKQD